MNHDNAITERIPKEDAVVLSTDMGWSDPGTLYALKEALVPKESDNLEYGLTKASDCKDTMIYNLENGKLVTGVGLDGMVVVNTKDIVLVVPRDKVIRISKLVEDLSIDSNTCKYV